MVFELPREEKTRAVAAARKAGQSLSDFAREALELHCSRKRK
jgi:predicted HicB family RNase H-like nuclease